MLYFWLSLLWAQAPLWEHKLNGGNSRIELMPDGNVLVFTNREAYALRATDGSKLWQVEYPLGTSSADWQQVRDLPIWENGMLINPPIGIADDSISRLYPLWNSRLYRVLNAATGKVIYPPVSGRPLRWVSTRTFMPQQGLLIVAGEGDKDEKKFFTTQTTILMAIDLHTGERRWRRMASDESAGEYLVSNIVAYGERLYYLTLRALYAIDPATGQTIWRKEIVKTINFRPITGTYLFVDEDRDLVVAYSRGLVIAVRRASGEIIWKSPVRIARDNVLHAFSTDYGILLFTDDVSPGSPQAALGNSPFTPPLAVLLDYESGVNRWEGRLTVPGLLSGFIPLDERRLFCMFQRQRSFRVEGSWKTMIDVLDVSQGRFLFRKPIALAGTLLHARNVPGGFLIQTTDRLQYLSEEGEVLWEKPVKRPFEIPFAIREEGGIFQAFLIDETGQVFRWDGPGTQPRPIGNRLVAFQSDPPQGLVYQGGKLWIWGGSTFYGLTPDGEIACELRRPVPAQPAAIRLLGATISAAAFVGAAYFSYKAVQTAGADIDRAHERPDVATSLKKGLKAAGYGLAAISSLLIADVAWQGIVKARHARMKETENLVFLLGMEDKVTTLYAVDKDRCIVTFQKPLGKLGLLSSLPEYEIDPIDRRLFVIEKNMLRAYSFQE